MPDTFTPNFGLTLPEIGASRDTWGAKLNQNTSALDTFVGMATPIGAILDFAGPNAPSGWLVCDGRLISRTTYSALFGVIGTYWGAGDGSTTFALPNMIGRAAVGPGVVTDQAGQQAGFGFATTAGFIWNTITQAYLPNYAMATDAQGYHNHTGPVTPAGAHYHTTDAQGDHNHAGATTGDNPYHTHSGTTDTQGNHNHVYNNVNLPGGAGFVIGSGAAFNQFADGTSNAGAHAHNFTTGIVNQAHTHGIYGDGNHAHTTTWVGDHQHWIQWDGNHAHNVWLNGSGVPFEVMGPIIVVTKIIYAGTQAALRAVGAAAPVTLEGFAEEPEDELAAIREELAQLRALLGGTPRRRMLSAPLRGPH